MYSLHQPNLRPTALIGLAAALLGTAGIASAGELDIEVHNFTHTVLNPQFGTTSFELTQLDQFDTMGGTRELVGYYESLSFEIEGTAYAHANNTLDTVGAQFRWSSDWHAEINGMSFFPNDSIFPAGVADLGGGSGAWLEPFSPGSENGAGGGYSLERFVDDPFSMAILTGTGTLDVAMFFNLHDANIIPLDNPFGDPFTFDPTLIDIQWDHFVAEIGITYVYRQVPAPGGLALIGLGGLMSTRRRR